MGSASVSARLSFFSLLYAFFSAIDGGWSELEHEVITNNVTSITDKQQHQRPNRRGLVDDAYSEMSIRRFDAFVLCLVVVAKF